MKNLLKLKSILRSFAPLNDKINTHTPINSNLDDDDFAFIILYSNKKLTKKISYSIVFAAEKRYNMNSSKMKFMGELL